MKTAEQILDNVMCCTIEEDAEDVKENYYYKHDDVVKAIEDAQKEAYNEALRDAANNAEVISADTWLDEEYKVNKQSILKLKK